MITVEDILNAALHGVHRSWFGGVVSRSTPDLGIEGTANEIITIDGRRYLVSVIEEDEEEPLEGDAKIVRLIGRLRSRK